ncbi:MULTISPECIES: LysR family transcriptional regulator [unclassified Variovorax]|uniref:LysR family transcriptional regulator n=1 Tax=unclassified Variovorax TaxID=663243 RepID=UPI0013160A27|nr:MULTISPECIES: LysR family transcriptional regulator [unclassified Variovorax]VTU45422.1 D-malate degradation protein R [Variovorax sp. PBL-E5]VTU46442.1 D-malate degradation protein R [Variovorax sp. SRS16]
MEVFVRVAECGSFSRAADSLNLANATVTTCVRNLERHLGVTLIHRDTRRLRLTEEGQLYLPRARELLHSVAQTEEEVRTSMGELRGALHIEMPISIGHALVCPALPTFAQRHPAISTAITLTNQPHHMIERAIDIAIRMDSVEDADLIARPIYEARYVVCCAPRLAASLPADPAALDPHRCLGILAEERSHANGWKLERGEEKVEIKPQGPLHFNSSDALLMAARAGVGAVHVLDIFAHRLLDGGELVRLYPEWTTAVKTFYAVTAKARSSSAKVRAFTEFLVEVLDSERRPSATRAVAVRALGKR